MIPQAQGQQMPSILPRLRGNIDILPGPNDPNGANTVVLHDKVRQSYFRMAWPGAEIIARWQPGPVDNLVARVYRDTGVELSPEDVGVVLEFLKNNELIERAEPDGWKAIAERKKQKKKSLLGQLLHNYLFFRMPLYRPEPFMNAVEPWTRFLFRKTFWLVWLAFVVVGIYLVSREFEVWLASMPSLPTMEGVGIYAFALFTLKIIHEFGHAFTAHHFKSRVPTMGIAVMLGTPVLYTDTTDSWRLVKKSERLKVVGGGVMGEAIVAGACLFLWAFLPEGLPRMIATAFTTTSLVTTLMVNLNPFMRYDGYFALSDLLGVDNLQPRAFALAKWKMRETLFGLGRPQPEYLPQRLTRTMIIYAYAVWVYRFFLFMGIAWFVYAISFKLLGIFLCLFEIVVFIAKPIYKELKEWYDMRGQVVSTKRGKITMGIALAGLVLFVWPFRYSVELPAVMGAANEAPVHARTAAMIDKIHVKHGDYVEAGTLLFDTIAPTLQTQITKTKMDILLAETKIGRLSASTVDRDLRVVTENQLRSGREKLAGLQRQVADLGIKAPISGHVVDVDPVIKNGLWIGTQQPLARVVAKGGVRVRGMVEEHELHRVKENATGTFIPHDAALSTVPVHVTKIASANEHALMVLPLADVYGGPIPVTEEKNELRPKTPIFAVNIDLDQKHPTPLYEVVGVAKIEGIPESEASRVWKRVVRVLVREQSF